MGISLVFLLVGVLRMFSGVECGHLLELKKLALSRDASLLHNVPDILSKIAWKLVKHCGPNKVCHTACKNWRRTG
jgi:hypothetical protein